MEQIDVTSVSSKGQVVIPNIIRKKLGISSGSKLIVLSDGDHVLLKPIKAPKLKAFNKLIKESRQIAKESGVKKSDIPKLIKKARNENSS